MTLEKENSKRSFFWRKSHSQQNMDTPGVSAEGSQSPPGDVSFQPDAGGTEFVAQDVNLSSLFGPFIKNYVSNLSHNKSPTKLPYPPNFYYPASSLQHQMILQMSHFDVLLKANTLLSPQDRFLAVLKYCLSTCSLTKFPYKPIISFLGETAQSHVTSSDGINNSTSLYIGEQVVKEPASCAFYISNTAMGVVHEGGVALCPKFKQAHVRVSFEGQRRTILTDPQGRWQEVYTADVPDLNIRLLRMHTELGGEFNLTCENTGYAATVQFKDKPIFGGVKNALAGKVTFQGRELFHIEGTWDDVSYLVEPSTKNRVELFNRTTTPKLRVESLPYEQQRTTSGDREWAPLVDCLNRRDFDKAKARKAEIDAMHHERAAMFEAKGGFVPTVFAKGPDGKFWIKDPSLVLSGLPSM